MVPIAFGSLIRLDIYEHLTDYDAISLAGLVAKVKEPDIKIVEVGSWKGFSTAHLADSIRDCGGNIYAVDHWKGNDDIYLLFENNLKALRLWDFVTVVKLDSLHASFQFADESVTMVFMDADHHYQQFIADLKAWYPKVKKGGILCGHDCERYFRKLSEEQQSTLRRNLDKDYFGGMHPGIVVGLHEQFAAYTIVPNSTIWFVEKEKNGRNT